MVKFETFEIKEQAKSHEYAEKVLEMARIPSQESKEGVIKFIKENVYEDLTEKNKNIIDTLIKQEEDKFVDQREVFRREKVVNKEYAKQAIRELINEGNNNFARIEIDVEGLKSINDIVGHDKGDIYLQEIHKAINKTVSDIKSNYPEIKDELEFSISAEGGDEFGVLIVGKEEGQIDVANNTFRFASESKPVSQEKISTIFGRQFNDNLNDMDYDSFITREDIYREFPEARDKYPDYKFFASASFGAVEYKADDWYDTAELEPRVREIMKKNDISKEDAINQAKYDLFLNEANRRMHKNKDVFKEEIRLSGRVDSQAWQNMHFHSQLLARSEEHKELLIEHQKVVEENEKLKAQLKTKGEK